MSATNTQAATVDAEVVNQAEGRAEALPLATRPGDKPQPLAVGQQRTAAQAKIEAIADLTAKAYEKASLLILTPEEQTALKADFPDEAFQPGAAGNSDLLYIQHAALRQRSNDVIGIGQWIPITRSRWSEEYEYYDRNSRTHEKAIRVYTEVMLMVRGCFAGEAVGDMSYFPKNQMTNYGDAVEGAKTAALRRCAKELGVGLQAWDKNWCKGWWERHRAARRGQTQAATQPDRAAVPNAQFIEGVIEDITEKSGTKKDGKPWTAWGIKIRGEFYRTFSASLAEIAKAQKGKPVKLEYTQTDKGRNAVAIEAQEVKP